MIDILCVYIYICIYIYIYMCICTFEYVLIHTSYISRYMRIMTSMQHWMFRPWCAPAFRRMFPSWMILIGTILQGFDQKSPNMVPLATYHASLHGHDLEWNHVISDIPEFWNDTISPAFHIPSKMNQISWIESQKKIDIPEPQGTICSVPLYGSGYGSNLYMVLVMGQT